MNDPYAWAGLFALGLFLVAMCALLALAVAVGLAVGEALTQLLEVLR